MNKVGFLAGWVLVPFLFLTALPMGYPYSQLPLFWLEENGFLIGIFGKSLAAGMPVMAWWFFTADLTQLLVGIVIWFFPLIGTILCFAGVNKPPDKGSKIYMSAFILQLIVIVLFFMDALFLGQIIVSELYSFMGLIESLEIGFWIYAINLIFILLAAKAYKEN